MNILFLVSFFVALFCAAFLIGCIVNPERFGYPASSWKRCSLSHKIAIVGADQFVVVAIINLLYTIFSK